MIFSTPTAEELSFLRPDPLLVEQELDVRPEFAERLAQATVSKGRVYWRSKHDHLYALEMGDFGHGRPSVANVFGHWDRFEPRPPEHEMDADLLDFCLWAAEAGGLNPADIAKVAEFANIKPGWPEGSVVRTPEECFANLPGFAWTPKYVEIEGLRMAYVEAGEGDPILMLHGEPTWGYLYRRMIEPLSKLGRVIVPDLIGFGRSDKPVAPNAYTYKSHCRWMRAFIAAMGLEKTTLVCQDWGGCIGLRVLAQMPDRFARLVAMNTGISDGRGFTPAFGKWRRFSQRVEMLDVPALMRNSLTKRTISDDEANAYQAPYPAKQYQTGALVFPRLVPTRLDHPGAWENREAIATLATMNLPVFLPWGDQDAITAPAERVLRKIFKNAAPAVAMEGAGHFVQEDAGEELAAAIATWLATPHAAGK